MNPLDVIEQITYLMFIHDLDDADNKKAKDNALIGIPYKSIFEGEVQIGERKRYDTNFTDDIISTEMLL